MLLVVVALGQLLPMTADLQTGHAGVQSHLGHAGVLPQAQLVLGKPVRRQNLALVTIPLQRAHLRV